MKARALQTLLALLSLTACSSDDDTQTVAGTITGLTSSGLVLANNGTSQTVNAGASSFVFSHRKAFTYNVTVAEQPMGSICTVANGTGAARRTVTDIAVTCNAETHSIAGQISGLTANGLTLQLNGADDLTVDANASAFEFATPIAARSAYSVTVSSQPTGLTCTVNNGVAANINADVSDIQVVCSATTFPLGGAIAGLSGNGLVLRNNGADDLTIAAGLTSFQFATPVAYNGAYDVSIAAQPNGQTCSLTNGAGTAQANITNVQLTCANIPTYVVTTSAGPNGTISPSGSVTVNEGDSLVLVAMPNTNYAISQWLVNGSIVQTGGTTYMMSNVTANATVQATFATATLTLSASELALSVNDTATNAALTGTARSLVVTNTGGAPALNVTPSVSGLPAGTTLNTTCGATLAGGSSCTITFTPGSQATSSCTTGIAPTPSALSVSADNTATVAADVVVLGYGCLYQGGYMFAVDDSTPATASIGGKVLATTDQADPLSGVIWSTDGTGPLNSDNTDLGLNENSLSPCVGAYDGACNSSRILAHYSPASAYPRAWFAAGVCTATISSYSDWYLPAKCEFDQCGGGQNIYSSLVQPGIVPLNQLYWTSTEYSPVPDIGVFHSDLGFGGGMGSPVANKFNTVGVRCTRQLTN